LSSIAETNSRGLDAFNSKSSKGEVAARWEDVSLPSPPPPRFAWGGLCCHLFAQLIASSHRCWFPHLGVVVHLPDQDSSAWWRRGRVSHTVILGSYMVSSYIFAFSIWASKMATGPRGCIGLGPWTCKPYIRCVGGRVDSENRQSIPKPLFSFLCSARVGAAELHRRRRRACTPASSSSCQARCNVIIIGVIRTLNLLPFGWGRLRS
jgi:hypothetical protein